MRKLLLQHLNQPVCINYLRPHHIDVATVVAVEDDWFTIRGQEDGTLHHYPYGNIIQIAEKEGGIDIGQARIRGRWFRGLFRLRVRCGLLLCRNHGIEQGTHQQLLQLQGRYRAMWELQQQEQREQLP